MPRFAIDLFRQLAREPGNLFFSPVSLTHALAMVHAGARGATAAELARVLGADPGRIEPAIAAQLAAWAEPSAVTLAVANRLFGERSLAFEQDFLQRTARVFGAPLEPVDFKNDRPGARRRINTWVAERTANRIRDLLDDAALVPLTRLVLVNAIYFKGRWLAPFDPELTRDGEFSLPSGARVHVPTMANFSGSYGVTRDDGEQLTAVRLPYEGDSLSMVLLVPDRFDGLPALERRIDGPRLARWVVPQRRGVSVRMPKFRIAPDRALRVKPVLRALGVSLAFDPDRADLSGIARTTPRLLVDDMLHKGFIEVTESGTEAAAASAAVAAAGGPPKSVVVDRPFVFLIRDERSGAVLFFGRLVDPR